MWVIRIILPSKEHVEGSLQHRTTETDSLLEAFRRAGLINVLRDDGEDIVFDILPPEGAGKIWTERNAQIMNSFGYNAASAPRSI